MSRKCLRSAAVIIAAEAVALALLLFAVHAWGQTLTLSETSPYTSTRIGMNIAGNDRYGTHTIKDLVMENPGMQPTQYAGIVVVGSGTTTTFQDSNSWNAWAANLFAGGTFQTLCPSATNGTTEICTGGNGPSVWSDVPGTSGSLGCHGTISSNTAAVGGSSGSAFTVSSACPVAFAANDIVIVRSAVSPTTQSCLDTGDNCFGFDEIKTGSGAVSIDTTSADFPASPWQGVQVVKLDTSAAAGSTAGLTATFSDVGTDYFFAGSYTQAIAVKVLTGSGLSMTFSGARTGSGANWSQTVAIPAGSSWQTVSATFTVNNPESGSAMGSGAMKINFTLSGQGTVVVSQPSQGYLVSAADQSTGSVYMASTANAITTLRPQDCRYWGGAPNSSNTVDNWTSPSSSIMPTSVYQQNISATGAAEPSTPLNDFLKGAQAMGCTDVQVVLPVTMPWSDASGGDNDVQHMIEFLNGPNTTTLGAKREAEGGPSAAGGWSSVFGHIDLSYGNEVWNAAAGDESMPLYSVGSIDMWAYSLLVGQWCGAAHGSPYWQANDWCGATVNPGDGGYWTNLIHSRDSFGKIDSVEFNGYTVSGGWNGVNTTDCTNPNLWLTAYAEAIWGNNHVAGNNTGFYNSVQAAKSDGYHVMIYEYQNNTVGNNSCTAAQLNGYANGIGYGIVDTVQALEGAQYNGLTDWNFFTLAQREFNNDWVWGAYPQMPPSAYDNARPNFLALQMANNCGGGTGTRTAWPVSWTSNPTFNFSGINGVTAAGAVPYLYGYEFGQGSTRCLVLANLDPSSSHAITVNGTNAPTGSVTQDEMTSANITDNNDAENSAPVVTIATSTVSGPTFTVPAHSMVTETWTTGALPPMLTGVSIAGAGGATSVNIGSTLQVNATCQYSGGSNLPCNSTDANGSVCNGWTSSAPSNLTVDTTGLTTGVAAGTSDVACTATQTVLNPQNTDDSLTGWTTCILPGCNPGGSGTPVSTNQTINNPSPSKDGESMNVSMVADANYTNALWTYRTGTACDECTYVTADFWVYLDQGYAGAQAYEFDSFIFDQTDTLEFMFGTQWLKASGVWQVWSSGGWVNTSLTTSLSQGAWHHIVEVFHRVIGDTSCAGGVACMYFDSISLDGVQTDLNMKEASDPLPVGWTSNTGFQFQIDTATVSGNTTFDEYIDEANLLIGNQFPSNSLPISVNTAPSGGGVVLQGATEFSGGVVIE